MNSSEEVVGKSDYNLPWGKTQSDKFRKDDKRIMHWKKNAEIAAKELCWKKEEEKLMRVIEEALGWYA